MADDQDRRELWHVSRKAVFTWIALCLLLATTCAIAYVPLGRGNLPVSLIIAGIKAALVGGIFMRLTEKNSLHRLAACVGPIWVFIMFVLMGSDFLTR